MDKYVPGIPYYTSVDYSKECLVFSAFLPAKPTYSYESDIISDVESYIPYKLTESQSLVKAIGPPKKISVYCSTPTIDIEPKKENP